ncbi:DUF58 domain-containing protein [Caballeronia sp. LP006]|uniref:DUF58 domain-containing protein n=1 Tax=unclassified Caballeronia TaxID=2646786 RepID=UPI0020277AAB|nr:MULTISPECIES: DUF58 domain-containing protein [unclassified Caballeronia]MDR5771025.1 DUF58 domain-containing protein [Caballeronia sp. LZ002]MDR5802473.1 DUF58 domain-containing protein [Caballeronia sp. LZ001]MDR5830743.1 DUF58 domain-containing protein [Caballeronia sp. LP006]MDR5846462.1 DUF58 domain-containing protein [Caballeronia sp. LZ003]
MPHDAADVHGPPASAIGSVYVDAAHLAGLEGRARGLSFVAPAPVTSILSGRQASRMRGRGLNFEELRGYLPGDDIRHLDWRVSLRTGKPHVRVYTEERDRPLLVIVDQRMNMFFGSSRALKSVVAAEAAALAVWMAFAAGDRVGGVVFGDEEVVRVRPLRSRARIDLLFGAIARMNASLHAESLARTNYAQLNAALEGVLQIASHDFLVCIMSDFAGADERTRRLLRQIAAHNDVIAALVFDPLWQGMPEHRALVVSEGRLQVELRMENERVRAPLASLFKGRAAAIAELLRTSGVPLMALSTAEPVVDQVRRLFGERVRRAAQGGL